MKSLLGSRPLLAGALLLAVSGGALLLNSTLSYAQDEPATPPAQTDQAKPATPPEVGDTAPDFELQEIGGEKVSLAALSAKGPVVLLMLRGFPGYQCPLCTAQVGSLINKAKQFSDAGASVLLVYPGPAQGLKEHADEFARGKNAPANFHLALDPDFGFTNSYGLRWDAKGETSFPSTFVLDTERVVLFAKVSHSHGGRATADEILAALPTPKAAN